MGIGLVLVYHRIASLETDPWGLCVSREHFEQHLEIISKCTRPIRLETLLKAASDEAVKPRSVAITFDDGYCDVLQAASLLERHDIPATAFLSTGYIEDAKEFWWDELERILLSPIYLPEVLEVDLQGVTRRWELGVQQEREWSRETSQKNWRAGNTPPSKCHKAYEELSALLCELDHPERDALLRELRQWAGLDDACRSTYRPLTTKEVTELGRYPLMDVGSHAVSHSALSALTVGRQRQEITESRNWLESHLGSPINTFAYPFGQPAHYTDETIDILRKEGFACACTTAGEVVQPGSDLFRLPRFWVMDLDGDNLQQRLDAWLGDGTGISRPSKLTSKSNLMTIDMTIDKANADVAAGQFWGAKIDSSPANVAVSEDTEIVGWVLGREANVDSLELVHSDQVIQRESVGSYRPDVGAAFPQAPEGRWSGFRFRLDAPSEIAKIELLAVLDNRQRVPLATIRRQGGEPAQRGTENIDKPIVGVIIPCYNQAHYLTEAIESVLAQTHDRIEIVVVDDGSTDNTSEVAARYPGILCVRQENKGLSSARNRGLQSTAAPYVMFLDADDRLLPDAVRTSLDLLESHPEWSFVSGSHRVVATDGTLLDVSDNCCFEGSSFEQLLRRNYIVMHATVMYRREAIEREQGFDVSLGACEDYDLYLRIARNSDVGCHDKVIAEYRQHEANMTKTSGLMLKTSISVLNSQWRHAKSREYRKALHSGLKFSRDYFGGQLIDDLNFELHERDWRHAARDFWSLVRYHPGGLTSLIAARLQSRIGKTPLGNRSLARVRTLRGPYFNRIPTNPSMPVGLPRSLTPVSESWGFDRGLPIDRYYIESFLRRYSSDVQGRVLEIGDNSYTYMFGRNKVVRSDVLNRETDTPGTTIVGDLAAANHVPSESFDCVILTQTLHLIYDTAAALRTLRRILAPGGVLLLTVPGITRISQNEWPGSWFWSFTTCSIRRLFKEVFSADLVDVEAYGNVLTASAFLYGMAAEELTQEELDHRDPNYEVTVVVRACKGSDMIGSPAAKVAGQAVKGGS
jgi:glycosyltransferase involved in cell wall biosynthesis/peptidoglycan/xylan/chitin deacetylase (PgdA/CDA1 family)